MEKSKIDYDTILKHLQIIFVLSDWIQDKLENVELYEIDHICEDIEDRVKNIRELINVHYELY